MYESTPRHREGEPIEEVLGAAINATATSGSQERKRRWFSGLPRHRDPRMAPMPARTEEPGMRVMKAGSPSLRLPEGSGALVLVAAAVVLALIVLVVILL